MRSSFVCLWLLGVEYYWSTPKRERWRLGGKFFPFFSFPPPSRFFHPISHLTKKLPFFTFFRVHFPFSASTIGTCQIHAYLIDSVFNLTDESCSRCEGLKNERDSARRENQTLENKIQEWRSISEDYLRQNQELQENLKSVKEEHGILQLSSRKLEAAKEEQQQKIRQLQRKNRDLGHKVTEQTSEYQKTLQHEKKKNNKQLKDCRERFQEEAQANIASLENMIEEKRLLRKEIKAERSKCEDLGEEVKRLREMPGRKCFA